MATIKSEQRGTVKGGLSNKVGSGHLEVQVQSCQSQLPRKAPSQVLESLRVFMLYLIQELAFQSFAIAAKVQLMFNPQVPNVAKYGTCDRHGSHLQ